MQLFGEVGDKQIPLDPELTSVGLLLHEIVEVRFEASLDSSGTIVKSKMMRA